MCWPYRLFIEVIIYSLDFKKCISSPEREREVTRFGKLVYDVDRRIFSVVSMYFRTARGVEIDRLRIGVDSKVSGDL